MDPPSSENNTAFSRWMLGLDTLSEDKAGIDSLLYKMPLLMVAEMGLEALRLANPIQRGPAYGSNAQTAAMALPLAQVDSIFHHEPIAVPPEVHFLALRLQELLPGSFGTGEPSKNTSPNPPFRTANRRGSRPGHLCIDIAALERTLITTQGGKVGGPATAALGSSSSSTHTTQGATLSSGCPGIPLHSPPPRHGNEQVDLQETDATCGDNCSPTPADVGALSSEPTAPESEQQPPACAPAGDSADPGPFTTCCEPPDVGKMPLVVLIGGAFGLLTRERNTSHGPVEKILLGGMTVGILSSFAYLLVRGNRG